MIVVSPHKTVAYNKKTKKIYFKRQQLCVKTTMANDKETVQVNNPKNKLSVLSCPKILF